MRQSIFALTLVLALIGCVADMPDDGPDIEDRAEGVFPPHGDHDVVGDEISEEELLEIVPKAGGCGQRWQLPPSVATAGRRQSVTYNSAGSSCSGGPTSGARELSAFIKNNFSDEVNSSIPGNGVQMYNCRQVRGGGSLSVHSVGRALDVFVRTSNGSADNRKGDQIANWFVQNAEHVGVQMIIWDRTIWYPGSRGERCYGGSHPHNDHVHIELNNDGANRRTAFFRGGQSEDVPQVEPPASSAWIGTACRNDSECNFAHEGVRGQCNKQRNPNQGVCTIPCAGYCPDRQGQAQTFCASRDDLGGSAGAGFCLAKSSSLNDSCSRHAGFTEVQVDRYVGRTRAPSRRDEVCAPVLVNNRQPDPEPEDEPEDRGGLLCGQPGLELSDHGQSCDAGENVWRCACSANYGVTISQVCRGGRWTTYHTTPRSCSACSGRYSSACN
jgi:hypothetical protein